MPPGQENPYDVDALLADFALYDRNVDIVSAYQYLFTEVPEMAATVAHFDRFPKPKTLDGKTVTPDFTVLFNDGHAYVGEISNIPLIDQGVDKVCRQLHQYDQIEQVQGPDGLVPVSSLDVLQFVQMRHASDAARRILTERLDDAGHPYKPDRRPVLIQYAHESDRYIFQVWSGPENGSFASNSRDPDYAKYQSDLNITPDKFAHLKVQHVFMNDRVKPLYLATVLWTKVFPSLHGAGVLEHPAQTQNLQRVLQRQYGHGRVDDIRDAMAILVAAGLAVVTDRDEWIVHRRVLRKAGADVHTLIAKRVEDGVRGKLAERERRVARRERVELPGQGSLFEQP
jgi:hypothetical protein